MEELGRADSALRGIVSVSSGLVGKSILDHGTEEQKQEWLPRLASATALGCFGLTEPGTGSDAGNLTSRAVRDGSDWVLDGQKLFITNGTWADVALVFARTSDDGPRGVTAFLVPTDSPGFEAREIKNKLGLRGQATAELFLSGVRVPDSARLGEVGQGFKIAMGTLDKGRLAVASGCVGIVQGCLEASVAYARERTQFGKPIASFQLVQDLIAGISLDADAARLLAWRCADLIDRGEPFGVAASKAKLFASEAAVRAANNAIQVHGGAGYVDDFPVAKYLRDARVMTLYEGTSQIQKLHHRPRRDRHQRLRLTSYAPRLRACTRQPQCPPSSERSSPGSSSSSPGWAAARQRSRHPPCRRRWRATPTSPGRCRRQPRDRPSRCGSTATASSSWTSRRRSCSAPEAIPTAASTSPRSGPAPRPRVTRRRCCSPRTAPGWRSATTTSSDPTWSSST